jgi:hypothetical protein
MTPAADHFVIRASDFLRHSSFGFRHFAACQLYDGKVAGARADFQMEIFLLRFRLALREQAICLTQRLVSAAELANFHAARNCWSI